MAPRDDLTDWLNNAYAMELALEEVLKKHREDAAEMPHIQERLQKHITETAQHAARLKKAIEAIGGTVSGAKVLLGEVLGRFNGMASLLAKDRLVKNVLADFAAEQFEIACYKSLIAAAQELGFFQIVEICKQNLAEEEAMAKWIEEQIPEVTRYFLRSEAIHAAA